MARWVVLAMLGATLWGASPDVEKARNLFARTQYKEALKLLEPAANSSSGPVLELIGKSYFMLGEYKTAVEAFEKAVVAEPNNSGYYHWLGKSFGRRAETSNPLFAASLASKARNAFERSVQLNPSNLEAVNDLFSYYLEAPGFLGGGLDKASELAKKIQAADPVEGHYALAQIAQKRKEFKTAEYHFRQAMQLAPRQVGRVIDLARFLSNQGRENETDVVLAQAEKVAPDNPRVLFERASYYIRAKKNLGAAKTLLQRYLQSPLTPDDPPRAEAERLLKQTAGA
jgi:tetratricopeptide (TPR) repeat protein